MWGTTVNVTTCVSPCVSPSLARPISRSSCRSFLLSEAPVSRKFRVVLPLGHSGHLISGNHNPPLPLLAVSTPSHTDPSYHTSCPPSIIFLAHSYCKTSLHCCIFHYSITASSTYRTPPQKNSHHPASPPQAHRHTAQVRHLAREHISSRPPVAMTRDT